MILGADPRRKDRDDHLFRKIAYHVIHSVILPGLVFRRMEEPDPEEGVGSVERTLENSMYPSHLSVLGRFLYPSHLTVLGRFLYPSRLNILRVIV